MGKYYHYDQNNSGGVFEVTEFVAPNVIIEADSPEEAKQLAIDMGIYFDGCASGEDCSCCGDRWYEADELETPYKLFNWREFSSDKEPETTKSIKKFCQSLADNQNCHNPKEPACILHTKDGKIINFYSNKGK